MDLCTFFVHGERYGVPILTVEEIFRPLPVTPVPGCHPWIEGILSLRGQSAVVLDLRRLLPRSDSPAMIATDGSRMILLEQQETLSDAAREQGLEVDEEPLVLRVDHVGTMCA
ncbi:MAG: chemotaxis protein CheW, partial [Planctomycetota bacterium]